MASPIKMKPGKAVRKPMPKPGKTAMVKPNKPKPMPKPKPKPRAVAANIGKKPIASKKSMAKKSISYKQAVAQGDENQREAFNANRDKVNRIVKQYKGLNVTVIGSAGSKISKQSSGLPKMDPKHAMTKKNAEIRNQQRSGGRGK